MAVVLLLAGGAAFYAFLRASRKKAEWLLCTVLLLAVGFTQIQDAQNTPRLPDFAKPQQGTATSGSIAGGSLSYQDLRWLDENGQRYIGGTVLSHRSDDWKHFFIDFEVFDATGNSLGVVSQEVRNLKGQGRLAFKLEVPFSGANRFKFLRFTFQ